MRRFADVVGGKQPHLAGEHVERGLVVVGVEDAAVDRLDERSAGIHRHRVEPQITGVLDEVHVAGAVRRDTAEPGRTERRVDLEILQRRADRTEAGLQRDAAAEHVGRHILIAVENRARCVQAHVAAVGLDEVDKHVAGHFVQMDTGIADGVNQGVAGDVDLEVIRRRADRSDRARTGAGVERHGLAHDVPVGAELERVVVVGVEDRLGRRQGDVAVGRCDLDDRQVAGALVNVDVVVRARHQRRAGVQFDDQGLAGADAFVLGLQDQVAADDVDAIGASLGVGERLLTEDARRLQRLHLVDVHRLFRADVDRLAAVHCQEALDRDVEVGLRHDADQPDRLCGIARVVDLVCTVLVFIERDVTTIGARERDLLRFSQLGDQRQDDVDLRFDAADVAADLERHVLTDDVGRFDGRRGAGRAFRSKDLAAERVLELGVAPRRLLREDVGFRKDETAAAGGAQINDYRHLRRRIAVRRGELNLARIRIRDHEVGHAVSEPGDGPGAAALEHHRLARLERMTRQLDRVHAVVDLGPGKRVVGGREQVRRTCDAAGEIDERRRGLERVLERRRQAELARRIRIHHRVVGLAVDQVADQSAAAVVHNSFAGVERIALERDAVGADIDGFAVECLRRGRAVPIRLVEQVAEPAIGLVELVVLLRTALLERDDGRVDIGLRHPLGRVVVDVGLTLGAGDRHLEGVVELRAAVALRVTVGPVGVVLARPQVLERADRLLDADVGRALRRVHPIPDAQQLQFGARILHLQRVGVDQPAALNRHADVAGRLTGEGIRRIDAHQPQIAGGFVDEDVALRLDRQRVAIGDAGVDVDGDRAAAR